MPQTPPANPQSPHRIAVIGGGISGLSAAWELAGLGGGERTRRPQFGQEVVVLESTERLGGVLRSEPMADLMIDTGPDGFLGRRPEGAELCRQVGLQDDLVPIGESGACVWARGKQRALPTSTMLGVPTRFMPVARSGVLSFSASLRLLLDVIAPRADKRRPIGDRALGPLVAHKLGQGVLDALVDPLIGGIHAGSVSDMSTAAAFPLLLAVSQRRGGLMRALRAAQRSSVKDPAALGPNMAEAPAFWSLRGGMGSLVEGLSNSLRDCGVALSTGTSVLRLVQSSDPDHPWLVETNRGTEAFDAVVLAVPGPVAGELLAPHDSDASTLLKGIDYASVATITLMYPEGSFSRPLRGTGLLVPRSTMLPMTMLPMTMLSTEHPENANQTTQSALVTACSYLSQKWPHLKRSGQVLVRASVGRFGDDRHLDMTDEQIVRRVTDELAVLIGTTVGPTLSMVTRWPSSFPQYRVHHLLRVAGIEAAVHRLPALAVAGSSYRGVGIPACIASGRAAANEVLDSLSGRASSLEHGR